VGDASDPIIEDTLNRLPNCRTDFGEEPPSRAGALEATFHANVIYRFDHFILTSVRS
jgi:hypothetical protein